MFCLRSLRIPIFYYTKIVFLMDTPSTVVAISTLSVRAPGLIRSKYKGIADLAS